MAKFEVQEPSPDAQPARQPEETICKLKSAMGRNRPFAFLLCMLLLCSPLITLIVAAAYHFSATPLLLLSLVPFAIGAVFTLVWRLRCSSTELTVTTRRTILRHGILSRYTTEVRHCDVRNVQVFQTFWQRLFGVGHICISSEADDEHDIQVSGMPHPDHIAETIRKMQ
jgi:uncharacterized membrane protein YdbT with pleckstrin-like domain